MADVRNKSRQDRLRAALRENLKRRKQQARRRAGGSTAETAEHDIRPGADDSEPADPATDAPEKPRQA